MKRFLLFTLIVPVLLLSGCGNDPLSPSVTVRYEVTGTAEQVDLDYIDENGDLAILNGQDVPWEITFAMDQGETVYIAATRVGETGTVTVKIYRNGTVVDEDTSTNGDPAEAEATL